MKSGVPCNAGVLTEGHELGSRAAKIMYAEPTRLELARLKENHRVQPKRDVTSHEVGVATSGKDRGVRWSAHSFGATPMFLHLAPMGFAA